MNPILMTVYDRTEAQHQLSKAAFESALMQDIPVEVHAIDNGSTHKGTKKLVYNDKRIANYYGSEKNVSPLIMANLALGELFHTHSHVLCIPNDVVLPPNLYRKMLERPELVVAAGMHGTNPPAIMETVNRIHGDVHMSVVLIRREAYETLVRKDGYFLDPGFFMYASDCDFKVRLSNYRIPTAQLDILCWHYGGASHRLAVGGTPYEQADKDREFFTKKWGFSIGSPEYDEHIQML